MSSPSFDALLSRAKTGDTAAINDLLVVVEEQLRRCVDRRLAADLREVMRGSDVLQNAYVEILRSLPTLESETREGFVGWVIGIIENDIRRQLRWFKAEKRQAPRTTERNALAKILLEPPPTPSAVMISREDTALLQRAMDALSDDHREILRLATYEGLSHRGIAERMQRTETATRMLLSRARAALGIELDRLSAGGAS